MYIAMCSDDRSGHKAYHGTLSKHKAHHNIYPPVSNERGLERSLFMHICSDCSDSQCAGRSCKHDHVQKLCDHEAAQTDLTKTLRLQKWLGSMLGGLHVGLTRCDLAAVSYGASGYAKNQWSGSSHQEELATFLGHQSQ